MEWPSQDIMPGGKVRLKANPSRVGIVGRELDGQGRRQRVLVTFMDGAEEFIIFSALEPANSKALKPYDLFRQGKFGTSDQLRRSMTFHRLSGRLSNIIYSLNTTNTQFMAYQFKPVINLLDSPSNGIIIADEVGLGKTIEAGLIWTELKARVDAKRLLVLCPAALTEKWKFELLERFGVRSDIVNADSLLKTLQSSARNPYEEFAVIGSIQGLRPPRDYESSDNKLATGKLALFMESAATDNPLLDLVIIDEAHYLRNEGTQTHKLGRLFRAIAESLIMLSATPIQLRSRDLFNLLNLLDEGSFPYKSSFDEALEANKPLVKLRSLILSGKASPEDYHELIREAKNSPIFNKSKQLEHLSSCSPKGQELQSPTFISQITFDLEKVNPLSKVLTRTLKRDVQTDRTRRYPTAIRVNMTPVEKQFYNLVTEEVRDYCIGHGLSTGFILTTPQRQMSSCIAAACKRWHDVGYGVDKLIEKDDYVVSDTTYRDDKERCSSQGDSIGNLVQRLVEISRDVGDYPLLEKQDSKFFELHGNLEQYWRDNPDSKVVLFAFFKGTLSYIHDRLKEKGIRSIVLHGGMNKNEELTRFKEDHDIKILLSSEVASEGVDLQFSSLLINYDLPWNPMRIEQRIGRIDRIGQTKERILIWNFVYADTIDERIYDRLLNRLNVFEGSLGELELILGEVTNQITREIFTHKLSKLEEEDKIERARVAIERNKIDQELLEKEANHLIAHGDFIQKQVNSAKEVGRFIRGEDLYSYIRDYLSSHHEGSRLVSLENEPNKYHCELSVDAKANFNEYLRQNHLLGKTRILANSPPPLLFDNQHMESSPRFERITQEHPLVRFITQNISKLDADNRPYTVNAIQVRSYKEPDIKEGIFAFSIHMCSVSGALDIERMEYAVARIGTDHVLSPDESEMIISKAAMNGDDWLSAGNEIDLATAADAFELCREVAEDRLNTYQHSMQRQNDDRINLMVNSIERRRTIEIGRIEQTIATLSSSSDNKKHRMIPANKARLEKLHHSFDKKISEVRLKSKIEPRTLFVSSGVIKVF
ncbi:SNF2-related protein [Halomonas maura]|uniref:SNF2-related protein n=1 Tax=Halomonas maura TaxID=117606 RepID=UPI0025B34E74|nr:SNF2-related protein [Halomonas maura]MDN3555519.1 SNF2-related protein [Halomonas maura]